MGVLANPRHEAFARARALQGMTATDAYFAAGYTGKPEQSEKISARADVKARILELQEKVETRMTEHVVQREALSRDYILRQLQENLESAKQSEYHTYRGQLTYVRDPEGNLVLDSEGRPIPLVRRDHRAINESARLLGMEFDMFQIKQQIDVRRQHFEGLTLDEIEGEFQNRLEVDFGFRIERSDIRRMLRGEKPENPALQKLVGVTIDAEKVE